MFVAENPSTFGSKPSSVRHISTSTLSAPLVAMTLITHPIAFESDSPVGTDIIGTRKLFMMQKGHSSLRKESTDRQPLTTIVNIIVIQQNILCLNMALLIYRVVTSGSIAIVYQILSMNASVLCSRISPLGATGDLCKDTAKCRHLHIAHILAYMCLLRRRGDATPCKRSVHYWATLQGVRRAGPASQFALRAHPTRRLHIPRPTGRPRSGCPSRGARAHPATDIRSYRTHSKESGAREKSEWKMTF